MAFSNDVAAMDAEIRLVARFHTLTLWRIAASAILLIFQIVYTACGLYTASPFYILLTANLLPVLLEPLCSPKVRKSPPVLPFLRKRYHYSSLRFMTMEITFFATNLLLIIWQFFGSSPDTWLHKFPAAFLAANFLWRFVGSFLLSSQIQKKMGC
ncbi:MAG: hypothetical protein K2N63_01465 [Lachnospiraceae bacterium]|nr:hypothetical protein [Lachnospiraceae bacterium]